MGVALIKLKIMPVSPESDLEKIKNFGLKEIKKNGGEISRFEEEPIAFGLKALIAYLRIDEKIKNTNFVETTFSKMPEVASVEIIDYRRAVE